MRALGYGFSQRVVDEFTQGRLCAKSKDCLRIFQKPIWTPRFSLCLAGAHFSRKNQTFPDK